MFYDVRSGDDLKKSGAVFCTKDNFDIFISNFSGGVIKGRGIFHLRQGYIWCTECDKDAIPFSSSNLRADDSNLRADDHINGVEHNGWLT